MSNRAGFDVSCGSSVLVTRRVRAPLRKENPGREIPGDLVC